MFANIFFLASKECEDVFTSIFHRNPHDRGATKKDKATCTPGGKRTHATTLAALVFDMNSREFVATREIAVDPFSDSRPLPNSQRQRLRT